MPRLNILGIVLGVLLSSTASAVPHMKFRCLWQDGGNSKLTTIEIDKPNMIVGDEIFVYSGPYVATESAFGELSFFIQPNPGRYFHMSVHDVVNLKGRLRTQDTDKEFNCSEF
jgi:hypothetical protein